MRRDRIMTVLVYTASIRASDRELLEQGENHDGNTII